jgi:hypothetical protein
MRPGVLPMVRHTSQGRVQTLCSSLNFAVAGVNTEPIIEAAPSGRRPTQHLQVRQTKRRQTSGATGRPAELKPNRVGLTADQVYLDPSWNHVVQRGRVSKITPSSPEPNPGRSQKFLNGKVTAPKKRLSLPTQYSQLRRPSGRLQWLIQRKMSGTALPQCPHLNLPSHLSRSPVCSTPYL